jgi:ElaB/YqjD/DUF883 family membrane-anchored ribosome-binding protein
VTNHLSEKEIIMSNAASGMNRDNLKQAANEAKETARRGAESAREKLHEGYDTAREKVQEGYDYAREHAQQAYDTAREKGSEAMDSLESTIRSNPLASLAVAAGVGVVVGLLLRGK